MITPGQQEKAIQFRQFHTTPPILVLPNAWDAASARVLERVGFRAIATTSSGGSSSDTKSPHLLTNFHTFV